MFIFLCLALFGELIVSDRSEWGTLMPQFFETAPTPKGLTASDASRICGANSTATETPHCVLRVVDGDTINIAMDGRVVRVRLLGIDTPEVVDPRKTVECFWKEASQKAKNVLLGTYVRIATDASQGLEDKYGRMLAYVYLPDGTLFNRTMVEDGYAHEYTYRTPYRYQQEFKTAERDARLHERGLWAPSACNGER